MTNTVKWEAGRLGFNARVGDIGLSVYRNGTLNEVCWQVGRDNAYPVRGFVQPEDVEADVAFWDLIGAMLVEGMVRAAEALERLQNPQDAQRCDACGIEVVPTPNGAGWMESPTTAATATAT